MPTHSYPVLVLLPGAEVSLLGVSVRARNARLAARLGAELVPADELTQHGDRTAVLVPPAVAIEPSLFPLPQLSRVSWLESTSLNGTGTRPAVLAGPARELRAHALDPGTASALPRHAASDGALLDVSTPGARRAAGWWLLRRTAKATDGWIARRCNRPISQAISYAALQLGLSANGATWLALVVGVAAAVIGAQPGWAPFALAGVLFHLTSVLDGVDGEIARTTLTESAAGARFDAAVDRLTAFVCFAGLMVGWIREGAGGAAAGWTVVVGAALALSLWRAFRFVGRHAPGSPLLVIDGAIRRAADRSGASMLRLAARSFALLRRDLFAVIFMAVGLTGIRALVPALVALGIVIANVTFSIYGRDIGLALTEDQDRTKSARQ